MNESWRHRFVRDPFALGGLILLLLVLVAALAAPWLAPADPDTTSSDLLLGPGAGHLLGTDQHGRDVLSRLLFASRTALMAGGEAVGLALVIGVPLGLIVGYFGGWWDRIGMRIVDALMAVPALIIAFAIIAVLGPGLTNAMLAVGLLFAVRMIRLVRGIVLSLREELYVDAARLGGAPRFYVMGRTILPNMLGPVIVQSALYFSAALLIEAMLSFLGVGVQIPNATWGSMLAEARAEQFNQPFLPFPPAIALTVTVLALNFVADGLRDSLGKGNAKSPRKPRRRAAAAQATVPVTSTAGLAAVDGAELRIRDLVISVAAPGGPLPAVRGVNIDVRRGEIVGVVGESGSGKSLTALSIMGLLAPGVSVTGGQVLHQQVDLASLSDKQMRSIRGKRIGMVFQEPLSALNPAMTVGAQIAETLRIHTKATRKEALSRAVELLDRVGVPDPEARSKDFPHQFSGGMAQRAVIAMALACEPELLIADEPTTALDVTTQKQVLDLLQELVDEFDLGVLLITHDMGIVAETCDRAYVMYAGQVVEAGDVVGIFTRPRHPYTAALLRSTPRGAVGDRLPTLPGRVPNLVDIGAGCTFAPRCSFAQDSCRQGEIPLLALGGPSASRCLLTDQIKMEAV